ncbi:AraC-type DNA-binding protein [Pseudomonas sp. NFACC24-1]|nr:AraC-type DNA-binding protein [Pseudomonas sp. NFACC24-1]
MALAPDYDEAGRDDALIDLLLHELLRSVHLPLHLPLPQDPRLLGLCQAFLKHPDTHASPVQWAAQLHISLRSFNRLFSRQTTLSFSQWRQQACVMAALARLAEGDSVTCIALDLGYDSPAAFSTMFRRVQGHAPSAWQEKTTGH